MAGWPIPIGPKPISHSVLYGLTLLPVYFFSFVVLIQTIFDMLSLVPAGKVKGETEITAVLGCCFQGFVFGLYAAQLSVAVTPWQYLRPIMSLWVLVFPYAVAMQVAHLVAAWFGHVFSLVPAGTTSEFRLSLTIAIMSAVLYSFVIQRNTSPEQQTQSREDSPTSED